MKMVDKGEKRRRNGAQLGQAQVKLKVIVEVVLEDGVEEVNDEDQLLVRIGGLWIEQN